MDNANPYEAPGTTPAGQLPTGFAKGWIITDLVFCSLKVVGVGLACYGASQLPADHPLRPTVFAEIAAGAGIALFGIPANILMLRGRRLGVTLAWVTLAFTAFSLAVSVWQASIQMLVAKDQVSRIGMMTGAGVMLLIRAAINVAYVLVVRSTAARLAQVPAPAPGPA